MLFGRENINPLMQGIGIFTVTVIMILILHVAMPTYELEWSTFATAILFFISANTLMGIFKDHWKSYFLQSVAVFTVISIVLLIITGLLTGHFAFEKYEESAMLIVLVIFLFS